MDRHAIFSALGSVRGICLQHVAAIGVTVTTFFYGTAPWIGRNVVLGLFLD
ncbi:hypothetical protein BO99DRAFT_125699 [Aspergillus violaceofuscus CBS 115571]|uniref:Uncharacterized protein n=1 Tax=Aspergillus violaceofuscus (strain CBS 115571) TaxID=1450538 RepID=A0A2V5IVK3_ASPV1|nr:hypothetical protein BO99DRAFT_125699 [Aspergillus violaceofuscus CBS 115571]